MYSVSGNRAVNVRPCPMDWVHPVVALASVTSTQWHPVVAQASGTSAMVPTHTRISFCQKYWWHKLK